jgi:hypothetical protein
MDPFCFGGCDPTFDPFCGIGIGPIGGGGGGRRGGGFTNAGPGTGNPEWATNAGSGPCGCKWSDLKCVISAILFPCKKDYGPEGCKETISKSPGPSGNQCADFKPPFTFVDEWSCEGDVGCCRKKEDIYMNKCYERGYFPWNTPGLGGGMEGMQCCKAPK